MLAGQYANYLAHALHEYKDGKRKKVLVYNVCDHAETYREVRAQAISYTTGVPAVTGAVMMVTGKWKAAGVFNMEEMDPDPFLEDVARRGLPWHVQDRTPQCASLRANGSPYRPGR